MRPRLAMIAASCATVLLAGGYAAAHAATTSGARPFSCTQTSASRAAYVQAITGTLNASGAPDAVVVTRGGVNEFGPVSRPVMNNSAPFDYYKRTYNLDTWDLGTRPQDTFGARHGYLGIPSGQSNAAGATFKAYWTQEWLAGGSWQKWFACTVS